MSLFSLQGYDNLGYREPVTGQPSTSSNSRDEGYEDLTRNTTYSELDSSVDPRNFATNEFKAKKIFIEPKTDGEKNEGTYFREVRVELQNCGDTEKAVVTWNIADDRELKKLNLQIKKNRDQPKKENLDVTSRRYETQQLSPLQTYTVVLRAEFHQKYTTETSTLTFYTGPKPAKQYLIRAENEWIFHSWSNCGVKKYWVSINHEGRVLREGFTYNSSCKHTVNYADYGKQCNIKIIALGDSEGQISCTEYKQVIGDKLTPHSVMATLCPKDKRSIDVIWSSPDDNSHSYIVMANHDGECVDSRNASNTRLKFNRLKQDANYYFTVGVEPDGKFPAVSNTVKTPKVDRKNFNIADEGKPKLEACYSEHEGGKQCIVSIDYPDIKDEGMNFHLEKMEIVDDDVVSRSFIAGEDFPKEYILQIPWGKEHSLCVALFYRDLDSCKKIECKQVIKVAADIQEMENLTVDLDGDELIAKWSGGKGANDFTVVWKDEKNSPSQFTVSNADDAPEHFHRFKLNENFSYGKHCKVVVTCIGVPNALIKKYLIGGDHVVSDLKLCQGSSPRCLVATWTNPKKKPNHMKAILYPTDCKHGREGITGVLKNYNESTTKAFFEHLRTSTSYHCVVIPSYDDGTSHKCHSNSVKTQQRKPSSLEHQDDFGTVKNIMKRHEGSCTTFSWEVPNLGENFLIKKFNLIVSKSQVLTLRIFGQMVNDWIEFECDKKQQSYSTENLAVGNYRVKITTYYYDLDEPSVEINATEQLQFKIELDKPQTLETKVTNNSVTFSWDKVDGAEKYKILVKDMKGNTVLNRDTKITQIEKPVTDYMCTGRDVSVEICALKGGNSSETARHTEHLGGNDVPRNVVASGNQDKPVRCIDVRFDNVLGDRKPVSYEIECIPTAGWKTMNVKQRDITLPYLKSGTNYRIYVHAVYEDGHKSAGSISNTCRTKSKVSSSSGPTLSVQDSPGAHLDLSKSNLSKVSYRVSMLNKDFDAVLNLEFEILSKQENADEYVAKFDLPQFNGDLSDYRIEKFVFKVKGTDIEENVPFATNTYETCPFTLIHGRVFTAEVKTLYEEIDAEADVKWSAAATKEIITRPEQPKFLENDCSDNCFNIIYQACRGAKKFFIEVTEKSRNKIELNGETTATSWKHGFNEAFAVGKSYKVKVIAVGSNSEENATESGWKIIGGEFVPQNAQAESDAVEPNTKALVSWSAPEMREHVKGYKVIGKSDSDTEVFCCDLTEDKRSVDANYLPAGKVINFMVEAIYNNKTARCWTNSITTEETPLQVQGVKVNTDSQDPATSVLVTFESVDAAKQNEETIYQVRCQEANGKSVLVEKKSNSIKVFGLVPGTKYRVTVRAGNSFRFGKESDSRSITTKLGTVKNLKVSLDNSPPHNMIVKFDAAEGSPVKYGVKVMKLPDVPHGELIWIKAKQRNMTVIESLDPNRQYWVDVTAIYELNEIPVKGIAIKSDLVLTAPHSAKIDKIKLSTDDYCGIRVEWEHVEGCKEYEVSVKIRNELEALLLTKELFCEYKCKNEAGCYSVQLRAKNKSGYFGGYSDEEEILLAPRKLTDIKLEFVVEEQREVKQIKASWEMKDDTVDGFYVNEYRENVLQREGKQEVKESFYIISDTVPSMEYYIEAWAYNFNKAEGPKEKSSRITTEPLQGKIDEVKVDDSKKYMFLIFWESQERCKTHVEFTKDGVGDSELVIYDEKTSSATYKGSFGSRYSVKIRMENKQKLGRWSEAKCIQLVPGKVKEPHLALIEYKLEVSWDLVNGADKYNLKLLSHEDGSIDDSQWKDTLECKYSFEPLKPGMAYQVIISAQNGSGKSEETISKEIRTKWDKPTYFIATPDLENPSAKAVLKWNRPYGVNCCRITVDDQPPKEVKCETQHISYSFLANKPGEECDIRLQCGRDGIYDQSLIAPQTPLIFAPNSPNSVELIAMPEMPSSLFLKIQEPNGAKPYEYKYSLFQGKTLTKGDVLKDLYHKIVGLQPNTEYHATVKCYSRNKDCPSTEVRSVPVKTFPDVLREINRRENNKYIFDIDPPHVSPNYYRIKCVGTDESSHLWEVTEPFFKVENVKSGVDYSITVAAVNVSGEGKYSDSILLRGHVSAPINVQVKNSLSSPTTALEVNFEITDSRAQEHRVMVQGLDLDKQLAPVIATHNSALVQDLIPGGRYQVHVVSVMDGIQSPGSSSKIIQTCPSQVQNLRVESVNFKTRKLLWDSLNPTPGCYKICHWINDETRKDEVLNESPFIIENFKPGYSYFFKVAAVNSSGPGCFSITKEYTENPAPPINLFAQRDSKNPTSAINVQLVEAYTDYPNKPDIYFIRCENVDTKEIVTQQTRSDPVVFEELSPGSLYQFSCRAETNGIPSKEIRAERIVRTALSPPLHIEAQVDRDKPSTQINVVITKANKQAGYYVIILASESDKRELSKRVDEDQVKFDDLKPGETYSIKGHAELHGDEAVTSSTSICDKTVQTYPPVCKRPEKYDERHNQTRFHWEVSAFPVRGYQISFSHDNSEDTYFTTNTYYDHMLECGQEYSVKVAFENNAGIGRFSEPLQFITKPSTPTITCWESKSKKEVLISCTASRRANKYIFKIKPKHLSPDEEELEEIKIPSGKPSLKLPLEHLDCVDYSISVIAANEAGNSDPSPPVWHKHYFNYIQDQMKKQVSKKYNEKQHVSANWENLFGETQEDLNAFLNLNAGQSVMLLGSLGSGKTQACFHYLMKTEFDEMVFYVDKVAFDSWNEISITGLLKELFPKLLRAGNNNRELLKFMDDNSNKLIFVIDNLSLANSNYTGCTYDDKVSVDCLFYNLVKEKRSLFTDSRVVFTSNTKFVYDAMNPTKICQLKGLQKEAIIKSVHRECKFLDHEAVEKAREYLSTPIIHELCTYPPAFTAFIKYMSSENSELTAAGLVSYMLHHEIVKKNELEEKDYSQLKQMWEEVGRVSALIAVKTKHTVELNSTDVYSKILVAMYIVLSQDYESFKLYLAAQCENPNLDPLIFQLVLGFLNANAPITIAKVFSQAEILPSTAVFETKSIKVPSYIKKKKDQINKRIKEGIIPKELWSTCLAELDNDKLSQSFASLNVSG